jgi:hypothetical protein
MDLIKVTANKDLLLACFGKTSLNPGHVSEIVYVSDE